MTLMEDIAAALTPILGVEPTTSYRQGVYDGLLYEAEGDIFQVTEIFQTGHVLAEWWYGTGTKINIDVTDADIIEKVAAAAKEGIQ